MCPNPQKTANLVTFTEEILNGKLHFLYRVGLMHEDLFEQQIQVVFKLLSRSEVTEAAVRRCFSR